MAVARPFTDEREWKVLAAVSFHPLIRGTQSNLNRVLWPHSGHPSVSGLHSLVANLRNFAFNYIGHERAKGKPFWVIEGQDSFVTGDRGGWAVTLPVEGSAPRVVR
jgi:hypothetical protein